VTLIAVAALSARMMAEAAANDGFEVIALDLFGDVDTRLAASQWQSLGEPGSLHIDDTRTLSVLRALTRRGGVSGWVAGSGFEGRPELLDKAASLLPLIGTTPEAVARVRDPAAFFGFLASQQIAHPPVLLGQGSSTPPNDGAQWLIKDARGCGGWHVRHTPLHGDVALPEHHYLQQQVPGVPMSALFIANGYEALVLGFNELTVRPFGTRPFVFSGAVGPARVAAGVVSGVSVAVRALTAEFGLRGLCSLDFMLDGDDFAVLEINPRPPASMALYGASRFEPHGTGLMAAHVRACEYGELPRVVQPARPGLVEGFEIVFARHDGLIDDEAANRLATWPNCHDLPRTGTRYEAGDPVCSLNASGLDAGVVRTRLGAEREVLLQFLETGT
jgi:predicted ATP-grasp superfamily ATP-dependent carboligase